MDWDRVWLSLLTVAVLVVSLVVAGRLIRGNAQAPQTPTAPIAIAAGIPTAVPKPPPCSGNTSGNLVKVSIAEQHMWMCRGQTPIADSPVTTGSSSLGVGTPVGDFHVADHEPDRYLSGPGYTVFVHYWVRLFGDIGFHDSPWQKFSYGDTTRYKVDGSRGCVHVPETMMGRLYDWAGDGTRVSIVP